MSFDFPSTPADGQEYAPSGGPTYVWHPSVWTVKPAASGSAIAGASDAAPAMDGTAAAGSAITYARGDHVHPVDVSRYAASNPSGYQTAANVTSALVPYAPLASPPLTGTPTVPNAAPGTSTTQAASTAFVQAAVAPALNAVGRNLIHNSMFSIAQRGAGPFSASGYTLDRWRLDFALDTSAVNPVDISGVGYGDEAAQQGMQVNVTGNAGASAFTCVSQFVENVRRLSGKTVTVSFWAYAVSGSPKIGVAATQVFGTGGSPSAQVSVNGAPTAGLTGTPTRYTTQVTFPNAAGKTLGTNNDHYSRLALFFSSGATNNTFAGSIGVQSAVFILWGVQLEIGSVATPLEKPDPQQDLAKCQRFFVGTGQPIQLTFNSWGAGATVARPITFPVQMRAVPALLMGTNSGNVNASAQATANAGVLGFDWQVTSNGTGATQLLSAGFTASADL